MPESLFKLSCRPQACEFCKISKNTFFYGTPPMAASGQIGPISMAYLGKCQTFPFISFV